MGLMNKKGEWLLGEHTVNIILAVLGIIILIFLAVSLYSIFSQDQDLEKAKRNLEQLINQINSLEDGQEKEFLMLSPQGWSLMSKGNRLCYCNFGNIDYGGRFDQCTSIGTCKNANFNLKILPNRACTKSKFEIKEGPSEETIQNCVFFNILPQELILNRVDNKVEILPAERKSARNILESLLEHKIDVESVTFLEILHKYIDRYNSDNFPEAGRRATETYVEDFKRKVDYKGALLGEKYTSLALTYGLYRIDGEERKYIDLGGGDRIAARILLTSDSYLFDYKGSKYEFRLSYFVGKGF